MTKLPIKPEKAEESSVALSSNGFNVQIDRNLDHWLAFLSKNAGATEDEYQRHYEALIKSQARVLKIIEHGGYLKTVFGKNEDREVFVQLSPKELKEVLESLESINKQLVALGVMESRETLKEKAQEMKAEVADKHLHFHANETGKAVDMLKVLRETQVDWQKDLND